MATFSVSGLVSGIDYNDLISKLIELERRPIYRLQDKQSTYNDKISVYNTFSTKLSALKSAADVLKDTSDFEDKAVSVSDSTVLTATASSTATIGVWNLESITQLATAHKIRSTNTVSSYTTALGLDSTDPEYGTDDTFKFTYSGTSYSVDVESTTTLESLKNSINALDAGVQASILNVGTESSPEYTLLLVGEDTGSANTISIDNDVTSLDMENDGVTGGISTLSSALDAAFRIDGIDFTRSGNTITDIIPGLTLDLLKTSSSSVSIQIARDTSAIKEKIEDFVAAYNDVVSYVSSNSTYNSTTHTGGSLFTESTSRNIIDRIRDIITSRVTGLPEDLRTLSQIGISTNQDATITLNTSTLDSKLSSNLEGVANLFTDSASGIGNEIYSYIDGVTDSIDGAVTIRINGLESVVEDISDDIRKLEDRLSRREEYLISRFASLEALLGSLTAQGTFLSNQLAIWQK